jgi:hypothetical protein
MNAYGQPFEVALERQGHRAFFQPLTSFFC